MSKSQKDSINEMKSDQDSLSNKQLLNKKKKRDSNISSEIFDQNSSGNNEIKCSICLGEEKLIPNCYKCTTCCSYFHLDCYNLFTFPETKEDKINREIALNNFECYRCKEEKIYSMEFKCYICKDHYGIMKKIEENKFLHHYCYVFFKDNLSNSRGGNCKACSRKKIPVLKCENEKCKEKFHIQCAIEQKIIFCLPYMRTWDLKFDENNFNEKIPFYCNFHNDALIKNFMDYSLTMQISKNDKIQPNISQEKKNDNDNNNEKEINIKKNMEEEDKSNKEQKNEEKDNNNNIINNDNDINNKKEKEILKEEKKPDEQKDLNKQTIITSVINLNNEMNSNSNSNINNIINNKEEKEKEEKESNNNLNKNIPNSKLENNNDSVGSSPNTPVKIDLSKHSSKIMSTSKLNNSNSDLINASLKKEKSSIIEDEVDIKINVDNNTNEENEEDDEDMEYNPPEIKREDIDLFDNFKNRNEKYVLPGAFYKFHF